MPVMFAGMPEKFGNYADSSAIRLHRRNRGARMVLDIPESCIQFKAVKSSESVGRSDR
jgi:hypothetical protein